MPDLLLAGIEYSGYISIVKFVVFLILFLPWLALVDWVHTDAVQVEAKATFWTAVVFGAVAIAVLIWMIVPVFIVGMVIYIIALAGTSASYVRHRNTLVMDFDRILTAEHFKGLLSGNKENKLDALKSFRFITANGNEVPLPEPRTPDFFGYKATYDLFSDAMWRRASRIMFYLTHENYTITYSIDGAAIKQPALGMEKAKYLIPFIKNLADLNPKEKRKPQKGTFSIHQEQGGSDWEVSTAGSTAGEQIQIKRVTKEAALRLVDVGLNADQYEQLNRIRDLKQGLFIISGPKKSGVTTTFYALLRNHDAFLNSINTLERQPAGKLTNITQNIFTLSDTGVTTYAKKLQSIVRMGPTIVGVADCTDSETAQVACRATKDGKIVYVTLEADNVTKALGKWIKLVGDKNTAIETLLGISCQQLLRNLCDKCKQGYEPNQEILRKFNIPAEKAKLLYRAGKVQYEKHNKPIICENCQGTGFVGRSGIFEFIAMNNELRSAIKQSKSLSDITTHLRRAKMLYLQEQALNKVINGTTSINEMVRAFSQSESQKAKKPEPKA